MRGAGFTPRARSTSPTSPTSRTTSRARAPLCALSLLLVLALTAGAALALSGCGKDGAAASSTSATVAATPTSATPTTATTAPPAAQTTTTSSTTTTVEVTTTTAEITTTTTSAPAGPTTTVLPAPTGWTTFEGDAISLALPATWQGGKPTAADTQTILEDAEKAFPDLEGITQAFASVDWQLMILGEPVGRYMPNVIALREQVPSAMSLQRYLELIKGTLPKATVKVESSTIDRLSFELTMPAPNGQKTSAYQYAVLIRSGQFIYSVQYTANKSLRSKLAPIFKKSGRTIEIRAPMPVTLQESGTRAA